MNYLLGLLLAFLLFPVVVSGLAQLSKYFDQRAVARSKDERTGKSAVSGRPA